MVRDNLIISKTLHTFPIPCRLENNLKQSFIAKSPGSGEASSYTPVHSSHVFNSLDSLETCSSSVTSWILVDFGFFCFVASALSLLKITLFFGSISFSITGSETCMSSSGSGPGNQFVAQRATVARYCTHISFIPKCSGQTLDQGAAKLCALWTHCDFKLSFISI